MDSDSTPFPDASAPLPGASIPGRGVSRRTFLTTTAALGIGAVAGTGVAGIAWGAPPPDCGSPSDSSKTNGRFWLWDQVKGCTPAQPGSNLYVKQISASPNRFYAIRRGGDNPHGNNDMLLMPTNRISGIECSYLRHDPPNWWSGAWREAVANIPAKPSSPLALGVNSKDRRGQDQLHIHLSQVFYPTFSDLRQIQPVTKISDWMTPPRCARPPGSGWSSTPGRCRICSPNSRRSSRRPRAWNTRSSGQSGPASGAPTT